MPIPCCCGADSSSAPGKEDALSHVAASAAVGEGTTLGHYCVIGENVRIGRGCAIGHHIVVHDGAVIGDGVRIDDHAVLGKQPMRAAQSAVTQGTRQPPVTVGDGCIIGTGAVVYAGAVLGPKVFVADLATIREEVTIGAFTIVGRGVAIENRCTIGRYCKLETETYIAAYSTLEDRVFVAPGVVTTNDNFVGRTKERFKHFKGVTVRRGDASAPVQPCSRGRSSARTRWWPPVR